MDGRMGINKRLEKEIRIKEKKRKARQRMSGTESESKTGEDEGRLRRMRRFAGKDY
jgi:hypothetical protein